MRKCLCLVLCILSVCAVFGLNARLDYDDLKPAIENISGTTDDLRDDLVFVKIFADVVSDFDVSRGFYIDYEEVWEEYEQKYYYVVRVEGSSEFEYWFESEAFAKRLVRMFTPMTWKIEQSAGSGAPLLNGIINAYNTVASIVSLVAFGVGCLISFAMFFITIVFDSIGTAWSLIEFGLYVLGFNVL